MDDDEDGWDDSPAGSEQPYNPQFSTDEETVQERLYNFESDEENGWYDKDRHRFALVRVPDIFLDALEFQV
jgi:hypothetical protein